MTDFPLAGQPARRVPGAFYEERPDGDCCCGCEDCGRHLPCEGKVGLDDTNLCCCYGVPWDNQPGGPCSEIPS